MSWLNRTNIISKERRLGWEKAEWIGYFVQWRVNGLLKGLGFTLSKVRLHCSLDSVDCGGKADSEVYVMHLLQESDLYAAQRCHLQADSSNCRCVLPEIKPNEKLLFNEMIILLAFVLHRLLSEDGFSALCSVFGNLSFKVRQVSRCWAERYGDVFMF